jgi:hypothetical protein
MSINKNSKEEQPAITKQEKKDPYAEPAKEYNDLYKQYINLERDYRDAKKVAQDSERSASQSKYELERYKRNNAFSVGGMIISWLVIAGCCMFFTAACVDGCSTREIHNDGAVTVKSIAPTYQKGAVEYQLHDNKHGNTNVILVDAQGKYNIGDTVKFTKQ